MPPVLSALGAQGDRLPGAGFLRVLVMPSFAFGYALTYSDDVRVALGCLVAPFCVDFLEPLSPSEVRQPGPVTRASRYVYGALLALLFVLQWGTLVLCAWRISEGPLLSLRAFTMVVLLVMASSLSGAVTGHELIHRKSSFQVLCGRLLLSTVLYEHFATEHVRGHHARSGQHDDPGSARFGESFVRYLRRAAPKQFFDALAIERKRLASKSALARILQNRVLQGLGFEALLCAVAFVEFGPLALALFVVQGLAVTTLFHAVSYIEHWGLGERALAWDTDNKSSTFSMLGLARHADHHGHPARPFHELRYDPTGPKLPHGYAGMLGLALLQNAKFRRVMTARLAELGLLDEATTPDSLVSEVTPSLASCDPGRTGRGHEAIRP